MSLKTSQILPAVTFVVSAVQAEVRRIKFGWKPKVTPLQMREAIRRRTRGHETLAEIGRRYSVSG
jgi:hypothetical protein